jgi:hypothetical protein
MHIASAQSGHWTDEQLIDYLYGVGPNDKHLEHCVDCGTRLAAMQVRRERVSMSEPVSESLLAAQRRTIYARLSEPRRWWVELPARRWASAAVMAAVLAGSATVYERHQRELAEVRADADLARDVSRMSFESEPQATAPLEGLFVE